MTSRGLHMNLCGVLAACGLGLNLVWCTLMGHTLGFLSSAAGLEGFTNPRLFFLGGILAVSLAYAAFPRAIKRADGVLRFVLPSTAVFATACFGLSYHQTFFDPSILAVGGLFVAGTCYFWLVARYNLLLARTQGFGCAVAAIAGGLALKLPVLLALSALASPDVQVLVAMATPVASALVFEAACAAARRQCAEAGDAGEGRRVRTAFGVPCAPRSQARATKAERRVMLILLAVAAVVLAVIRSVSYLGMWGDTNATISLASPLLTGVAVPAACVALFAWAGLVRTARFALPLRFQPALLLILCGLLVVAIQPNSSGVQLSFLTGVIQIDELFAHLLFWTVAITALDVLDVPSYRVMGVGGAVYATASIAWVLLLSSAAIADTLLVMLATYALVVLALSATWFVPRRQPEEQERAPLASTVADTCTRMAERYSLSPRETEVFILLAQGRTRSFIQDELVLSGSTVKTHVSHIYAKMGVADRQEMMDLIWK